MGSPNYVYRPFSEERKAKLREVHRKRLGNLEGHYRVYGVQVPCEYAEQMKKYAAIMASVKDFSAATAFVERVRADNWVVFDVPTYCAWARRDWQLFRDLIAEGMSREDVAEFAGISVWYLNKGVSQHRKGRRK